ncbi:similar to Saccharomyces cerevisiae YOR292C Putative protein of unknown function [Maudiozyma barnettii]|uniref:Uncharacterized protein n=1 Tax=Maudiozyma barnettii TaxID=61262 RepID=A0A8H2ZG10_9SACH|nr:hypothetical protein [Kazachstania barnettii]CAB4252925.1 similar to Saccharomyces cerevisiae YOR292C Putative protein of unknown function [Kazachstania barnettii]CAD1780720.1 similar to Saccharomyces cerevisiae YOR292C Putative protein of unknown function [Kazachstania barnettii]
MSVRLLNDVEIQGLEDLSDESIIELSELSDDSSTENRIIHSIKKYIQQIRYFVYEKNFCHLTIIHYTLLVIWFSFLINNIAKYQKRYQESRLRASRYLNTILFGCSDILAQSITCYYSQRIDPIHGVFGSTTNNLLQRFQSTILPEEPNLDTGYESDSYSVFNDYGITPVPSRESHMRSYENTEEPNITKFNFTRFITFSLWGQCISFFQVPWYRILNFFFTEDPSVVQVFERVLADQLLYSPIFLFFFFTYSNFVMERGNKETFKVKIQKLYISTLGCNLLVWPLAQLINFSMIPKPFQIPFSSSVGVLWNCFLSMRNASDSKSL